MNMKPMAILQQTFVRLRALAGWLALMAEGCWRSAHPLAAAERLFGVRAVRARSGGDTFST